jgi:serine/threonine-protein kinase
MDRVTAVDKLEGLGLNVTVTEEPTDDASKINYVQRQDPAPDTVVQPGTTVTIWVAVPNNIVLVPNLVGMSRAAAETALTTLGLIPKVSEVDSELAGGTVLTQNPDVGTQVQAGTEVALEVSNAPIQNVVTVPPVAQVNLTLAQATTLLSQYHLKVATTIVYYETPNAAWWDKVIEQDPVAGAIVPSGTSVKLTVGKAPTTTLPPPSTTSPPTSSPPSTP